MTEVVDTTELDDLINDLFEDFMKDFEIDPEGSINDLLFELYAAGVDGILSAMISDEEETIEGKVE